MSTAEIIRKLRKLDEEHRDDGDGGYVLLANIRNYRGQLDGEEDKLLQDVLLQLVEDQDETLWGVALESLVQEWGDEVAGQLTRILDRRPLGMEWEGHVLLALLRLGHNPITERSVAHISKRLSSGDRTVLPMVAALSRVSVNQCLSLASTAFINELALGNGAQLEGYLPAFVRNFLEVDANLLHMLVRSVSEHNEDAGRDLADMLVGYFDRPYVQEGVGSENADALKASITAACS